MSEVVEDSTSKLTDVDLKDIAIYLKSLPASPYDISGNRSDPPILNAGEAIYKDSCSACHQASGQGVPALFPSLKGSSIVQSKDTLTMLRLILNGGQAASTQANRNGTSMPSFGWKLSDGQIAAVASYVRAAWGNQAPAALTTDVAATRSRVGAISSAK